MRRVQHGEAALHADPTLAEAHANMSAVEYQRGSLSAAVGHAHEALRLMPHLASAHNLLGTACRTRDKPRRRWRVSNRHGVVGTP